MRRGDIHHLKPRRSAEGHEQQGPRFGVIVQNDALMQLSTTLVVPTSTKALAATFRPEILVSGQRTRLLVDQATAIDPERRLGRKVGHLEFSEQAALDAALAEVLGLLPISL